MVSPLSSRIYNLEAKAKVKNYNKVNVNSKLPWQIESRRKRISGYTADKESFSTSVNPEKQLRAEQVEAHAKKRKVQEQHFQAHNIRNDLINAGLEYSPRSRAFPGGTIDMSNVELIMSSKYSPDKTKKAVLDSYDDFSHGDIIKDYISLIDSSKEFFKTNGKSSKAPYRMGDQALSTTSSTTVSTSVVSSPCDSDVEVENESIFTASALPALAEKVSMYKNSNAICDFLSSSKKNITTLNKALMISDSARLIIEAKAPHEIVHSNASFSRLSGISNDRLIGFSLSKFIGEKLNHTTADICLSEAMNSLRKDDPKVQGMDEIMICKIVVFQVPSNSHEIESQFSHYVLDFEKQSDPFSLTEEVKNIQSLETINETNVQEIIKNDAEIKVAYVIG